MEYKQVVWTYLEGNWGSSPKLTKLKASGVGGQFHHCLTLSDKHECKSIFWLRLGSTNVGM